MYEYMEAIFKIIVEYGVLFVEFVGVGIIILTSVRCVWELLTKDEKVKLDLAKGIALALEFKLAGEVLRTTIVRDWSELGIVGTVIALRLIMTFLIHWEIKNEQQHLRGVTENDQGVLQSVKATVSAK